MLIKDLKGIIVPKVKLMYENFGEYEYESNVAFSIEELIENGYGNNKVKKIFVFRCVINIVVD